MGSDRARASFDTTRQYRSVVMQQGRVTVEADWNEAQLIESEEERKDLLDIVGPAGTPDDGYRVLEPGTAPNPPFDFTVGGGTMYVGGVRAFAAAPIVYSAQSEWIDHSTDPDWVEPDAAAKRRHEEIYLSLREQEVSAVEDTALREVALGGPDTAQRTRFIQHIVRVGTDGSTCDAARESLAQRWAAEGLTPDYATMRLLSSSTLQVTFPQPKQPPDPCDPPATGGYLGADNQLIRVQISGVDGNGNYRFVWGFDDASFLYRVQPLDDQNLRLLSSPVDQFHRPRKNQAVEALRTAVALGGNDFIASATGIVATLGAPYDADQRTVTLPSPLPATYVTPADTPVLFLRVWEEEKALTPGTPIDLGDTGVQVTLQAAGGVFHVGDFWLIAVRPSTPTKVYPQRLLDAPQPPDGPRLWFCPLAVIEWRDGILHVLDDCRNPFDNLVELTKRRGGGCCTVVVRPEDLAHDLTLQKIVDRFVNREKITICLMPGLYQLDAPLRLGPQHSNLTIEACHDGAVLRARAGQEGNFLDGLIVLVRANNVTLRGLRFDLPQVPFVKSGGTFGGSAASADASLVENLFVSIAVRPVHCAVLAIENCLFRFSLTENRDVFGVAIFAGSECWGFRLSGCRFVHEEDYLRNRTRVFRMLFGYLLMPTVSLKRVKGRAGRVLTRTILQDARIEENLFSGISMPALVMARTGVVAIENNIVRDCPAGFWLLSLASAAFSPSVSAITITRSSAEIARQWHAVFSSAMLDPVVVIGGSIARTYPLPAEFEPAEAPPTDAAAAPAAKRKSLMQEMTEKVLGAFRSATTDSTADSAMRSFFGANEQIAAVDRRALAAPVQLALTLTVTANQVDARMSGVASNACLLILDEDQKTESSVTMNGNIMQTRATSFCVAALLVERCAISGNVVANERENPDVKPTSIAVFPGTGTNRHTAAITGNVFVGDAILPPTGNASPVDTWHVFNAKS